MKGQKKRRAVKGMTLMECIVSILVFGIAGTIMCRVATTAYSHLQNANHLNNKVNAEAPVASIQNTATLYDATLGDVAAPAQDVQVTVTSGGVSCTVNAERYDTSCMASRSNRDTDNSLNTDIHFYIVQATPPPAGP